jgi:predicted nuclease of predicted toxin-antitoxin system
MKILIDESLPRHLKRMLSAHEADTVQELGWQGTKNGALLARAEGLYEVFLTADKNLRYQQNLQGRTLTIIEFPSNKLSVVKALEDTLLDALEQITQGDYITLALPAKIS